MHPRLRPLRFVFIASLFVAASIAAQPARWSAKKTQKWYAHQPWLVGANYTPATAINQLEMWQADTFDPKRIDLEFGWAEQIGMNTMRVFLHDLLWQQDPAGFRSRIDEFLRIAARHKIRPMFVLFDSCWDPHPRLGKQRDPKPGVHNSGWVQSPGADALADPAQQPRLEAYVKGVVGAFRKDKRILAWDLWNEPENGNDSSYADAEAARRAATVLSLLGKTFAWARAAHPKQPLTTGVWQGEWWPQDKWTAMTRLQLEQSDVISFHSYDDAAEFERKIQSLEKLSRPVVCTEYMARGNNSTFQGSLPVAKEHRVAAINWGLVAGKTQTWLPWDSWKQPYVDGREPAVWFHEVFYGDGRPYKQDEVDLIRNLTGRGSRSASAGK